MKSNDNLWRILQKLDISLFDENGEYRSIIDIIAELSKKYNQIEGE